MVERGFASKDGYLVRTLKSSEAQILSNFYKKIFQGDRMVFGTLYLYEMSYSISDAYRSKTGVKGQKAKKIENSLSDIHRRDSETLNFVGSVSPRIQEEASGKESRSRRS